MNDDINLISNDLQIDTNTHSHLSETARWAKFISIAGFVFSAAIVVVALYYLSQMNRIASYSSYRRSVSTSVVLAVLMYIGAALVWCVTSVFQYRFAMKMQTALRDNNQEELDMAFKNLKMYYRISGAVTILSLLLTFLGLIGIMSRDL